MLLGAAIASPVSSVYGQSSGSSFIFLPLVSKAPVHTNPVYSGVATYYYATGGGACMFDPSPADLNVAAMNQPQWANSAVCGEYVRVTGPNGSAVVRIVDLCPGCESGQLDLSEQAFAQIASLSKGVVPITWQVISPDLAGPIAYHFKSGSSQWWMGVQLRNTRNPVAKLEILAPGGGWADIPRQPYNYFVLKNPGVGPFTFRATDSYGNDLVDSGIPLVVGGTVNGEAQFPPGP